MTRWAEFLIQQERFIRRREKMYNRGWKYELQFIPPGWPFPTWVKVRREIPKWTGALQTKKAMSSEAKHVQLLPYAIVNPGSWVLRKLGRRKTPRPDLLPLGPPAELPPHSSHQRTPLIGYHRRRVHRVFRKPDRMNGFQRRCWGAAYHAFMEGWFPDWDPLQGHPNHAEFLAGADPVWGVFRQTPR